MARHKDIDFSSLSYTDFLEGLLFLLNHAELTVKKIHFNVKNKQWNYVFFDDNKQGGHQLEQFLKAALNLFTTPNADTLTEEDQKKRQTIKTYYELFLNLEPNRLLEHNVHYTQRRPFTMKKITERNESIPLLQKDKDGKYVSFEDHHVHEHGHEARRIGASTQMERLRGWVNRIMAKIGIHVFETARYEELNYLNTTIYANDQARASAPRTPSYYWIGHASNLIVIPPFSGQTRPIHVLTDPVEGSLFPGIYPRETKEGKLIKGQGDHRLPHVDVVLISHNHRDHVDTSTLKRLVDQQPKMIVPEGDKDLFLELGFKYVEELTWGEQVVIEQEGNTALEVTSVPARHWSGRGIHDAHKSAFAGYVLHARATPDQDIYFAGDTAELGVESSRAIYEQFNIALSIQPGGPDEHRRDMESTHQSSADGITAHFKNLLAHYKRLQSNNENGVSKKAFFYHTQHVKTIYDHTATFKLGNLRLRDTYYSYNRVLAAFRKNFNDSQAQQFLAEHEYQAYKNIQVLVKEMRFEGLKLTAQDIANIIEKDIIVPKIGQRFDLEIPSGERPLEYETTFDDRRLILNHRALEACDKLAMSWLEKQAGKNPAESPDGLINSLIIDVLSSYKAVWHAQWTRTHIKAFDAILSADLSLSDKLSKLQEQLTYKERHGHLQNIIYYAQWLNNTVKTPYDLEDFLTRLHIRQLVDQETRAFGSILIRMARTEKIKHFEDLANKLDKAESMAEYRAIYHLWLDQNKVLLSTNRSGLFPKSKTSSELAIDKISEAMDKPASFNK